MPNGVSPFNYRPLTPEQQFRGEKVITGMLLVAIMLMGIGYIVFIDFIKAKATDFDHMTVVATMLAVGLAVHSFYKLVRYGKT